MTARYPLVLNGTSIQEVQSADTVDLTYSTNLPLGSAVTGTLATARGGTGADLSASSGAILKTNGSTLTAATAATDYGAPGSGNSHTWLGAQYFSGSSSSGLSAHLQGGTSEGLYYTSSAANGTVNMYLKSGNVHMYSGTTTSNFTLNITLASGNAILTNAAYPSAITAVFMFYNGGTGYYANSITWDGSARTTYWQNGQTPTDAFANAWNIYTFTMVRQASGSQVVFASITKFA